jgi:hypothetical protein
MTCDHDWTIRFPRINDGDPFEIRPVDMSLKMSRQKYDFCRATFSWKVGEEMKPHTRYEGGALYGLEPVDVCYNGTAIQRLMFRPDWVDYTSEFTHLRLHDLQKSLADGVVDMQRDTVDLKSIYKEVVSSAANGLIPKLTDDNFTLPESQVRTLYKKGSATRTQEGELRRKANETDKTEKVVESDYAVDFDQISPERAIQRLNKKFRLKSWVNRDGELIIGLPEANSVRHLAAPDDHRVWRYKDPQISHGREPVKKVIVMGAWEDSPKLENDPTSWFDKDGTGDARVIGVAERTDIDYGSTFSVKSTGAKRNAVAEVARLALIERMKQQNAGTVGIHPELSGTEVSNPLDLATGDLLHLVPNDDYFENPTATSGRIGDESYDRDAVCGSITRNEAYLVSEVEHKVTDDGEWQMYADVGMYPDERVRDSIEAGMAYFDPTEEEWYSDAEFSDDGWLFENV